MASLGQARMRSMAAGVAAAGCVIAVTAVGVRTSPKPTSAAPTSSEARAIFYNLLKDRTDAVENNRYAKIEPLYAHDDGLLVLRHEVVMRGWPAVEAYWKKS